MDDPTTEGAAALAAIVAAPEAWSWEQALDGPALAESLKLVRPWAGAASVRAWVGGLAALGHERDTLRTLERAKWLVSWRPGSGWPTAWTLTPAAAGRLDVQIRERWGYERTRREVFAGPDRRPKREWTRAYSEEPRWAPRLDVTADRQPTYLPRDVPLRADYLTDLADHGTDPEAEARVAECGLLVRAFMQSCEAGRPDLTLLRRAESIVAGVAEATLRELRERWLWDTNTNLPILLQGRLVPRDQRLRHDRVG